MVQKVYPVQRGDDSEFAHNLVHSFEDVIRFTLGELCDACRLLTWGRTQPKAKRPSGDWLYVCLAAAVHPHSSRRPSASDDICIFLS